MANEFFDVGSCGLQIFSRVELFGVFGEEFSDSSGHSKSQIGVDIDFAYGKLSGFAELFFGYADSVRHFSAEFVYHFNVFLRNGRRTVQNYREVGEALGDFFENVETECGGNEYALFVERALFGLKLVRAVRSAYSDGKRVNARFGDEFVNFFGTGVRTYRVAYFVFDAGESAEFAFDNNAVVMRVFHNLFGEFDIVRKGVSGTVDHNGSKASVDAGFASFEVGTMVEVKNDGDFRAFDNGGFHKLNEVSVICVSARAFGNL